MRKIFFGILISLLAGFWQGGIYAADSEFGNKGDFDRAVENNAARDTAASNAQDPQDAAAAQAESEARVTEFSETSRQDSENAMNESSATDPAAGLNSSTAT